MLNYNIQTTEQERCRRSDMHRQGCKFKVHGCCSGLWIEGERASVRDFLEGSPIRDHVPDRGLPFAVVLCTQYFLSAFKRPQPTCFETRHKASALYLQH